MKTFKAIHGLLTFLAMTISVTAVAGSDVSFPDKTYIKMSDADKARFGAQGYDVTKSLPAIQISSDKNDRLFMLTHFYLGVLKTKLHVSKVEATDHYYTSRGLNRVVNEYIVSSASQVCRFEFAYEAYNKFALDEDSCSVSVACRPGNNPKAVADRNVQVKPVDVQSMGLAYPSCQH